MSMFYFYFCLFCINYLCLKGIWSSKNDAWNVVGFGQAVDKGGVEGLASEVPGSLW